MLFILSGSLGRFSNSRNKIVSNYKHCRNKGMSPPLDIGELFSKTKAISHVSQLNYAESGGLPNELSYRNSLHSFHPEVARAFENGLLRYTSSSEPPEVTAFYDEPAVLQDCQHAYHGDQGFQCIGSSVCSTPTSSPPRPSPEFRWQQLISPSRRI